MTRSQASNSNDDAFNLENLPFNTSKLSEQNKLLVNILMYSVKESQAKFQKDLEEKDVKIKLLDEMIVCLENRIVKLENKLETSAANECLNEIILSGKNVPTHVASENCTNVVRTVLHDKFSLNVPPSDILKCHRIGKKPLHPRIDNRSFLLKLSNNELKKDFIKSSKVLKPEGLFIKENLTATRNSILFALRKAKHEFPNIVSGCTSIEGNVYVWMKSTTAGSRDNRMLVNSFSQLNTFCSEIVRSPVAAFVPDWSE